MAELNLTPAHVTRSFDRLTEIVTMQSPEQVAATVARLLIAGKIDRQEGGLILDARQMLENGLDDVGFAHWNTYCTAAMETASNRLFRFLNWADGIAEVSYANP